MVLSDDICADLAFFNGKVFTLDSDDNVTQAVSVRKGKILRVGSNDYVKTSTGNRTKIVDLDGKTMLPGLIDSHMHPGGSWGAYLVRGEGQGDSPRELGPRVQDGRCQDEEISNEEGVG